ncbi:MAG: hypothetical protein SGI83_11860 [Bacteroidota bacterium]|nr:hypothetical protein [Bacteroidota bacterium]
MAKSVKKELQSAFNRLKRVMEKILTPKREGAVSQLILQPVRNTPTTDQKKYLRG